MLSIPEIMIEENPQGLANAGAGLFVMRARECAGEKRHFTVAISGGRTPREMYRLLAKEPYISEAPWERIDIFWADERCVDSSDPASNYGTARKDFLEAIPLSQDQVHPMPGELEPKDGAQRYKEELANCFNLEEGRFPVFDLIFLGIGRDGHTASLFPGDRALKERKKLVVSVKGGDPYVSRLTMTCPVFNHSKRIVFLVSGREKAQIVKSVLGERDTSLPAGRIDPVDGRLTWILDRDAASMIEPPYSHSRPL